MLEDDQGLGQLEAQRETADKQFKQVNRQVRILQSTVKQLGELGKFADTITPEDVVEAAGRVVASGAPAATIAGLMAQMPTEPGEALQGWVGQMTGQAAQALAKAQQAQEAARHSLATSSLRAIVGHTVAGHRQDFVQRYEGAAPGGALGTAGPGAQAGPATDRPAPGGPAPNAPTTPTMQ